MIFFFDPRLSVAQLIDLYLMHKLKEANINTFVVEPENRARIASTIEDVKNRIIRDSEVDDER